MAKAYVLYNPLSGTGTCLEDSKLLEKTIKDPIEYFDITRITNYSSFLADMAEDDYLIIAGGDGTLNRFANDTAAITIPQEIFYFPAGSGNDFARDIGAEPHCAPVNISKYLKDLPTVTVKGKSYHFINAVGFGLDGYCCEVGDELRKAGKKINYGGIAVRGLLGRYMPTNATVTVDGEKHTFRKVWIAPTLFGRYYGGGMMAAPEQDRTCEDKTISLMLFHNAGRLRTLCAFPNIFSGKHIKFKSMVAVLRGREITVEFDHPVALQIDGETILNVTSYTAKAAVGAAVK